MPSRWDFLLETKPVPLMDHLLEEVAKLVARELSRWPQIGELDPSAGGEFSALLDPGRPPPGAPVYREAFRLAHWELTREFAAYDEYMRNRRWLERGLSPDDRQPLLFLSRYLVEQMLALGESTDGRVDRRRMLECLERIERRCSSVAITAPA